MVEFEEYPGMIALKDKNWKAVIDDREINLDLVCEAIDMESATGEVKDEEYPILLTCSIMVDPKDMSSKYKKDVKESAGEFSLYDAYYYSGGVLADRALSGMEPVKKIPTRAECKVIENDGKDVWCKTEEDAITYAKDVYSEKAQALFGLIGFVLDNPVNRIGNTGWDIIEYQAEGTDYIRKALERWKEKDAKN